MVHYGVYARLAKLEIAAGEKPRVRDVALPEDTEQRARQWAKGEAAREKQRGGIFGEAPGLRQGSDGGAVAFSRHPVVGFAD